MLTIAIKNLKAGIKNAKRAGDVEGAKLMQKMLAKAEADYADMVRVENNFQRNIRPALVAKWAKGMDFSIR